MEIKEKRFSLASLIVEIPKIGEVCLGTEQGDETIMKR